MEFTLYIRRSDPHSWDDIQHAWMSEVFYVKDVTVKAVYAHEKKIDDRNFKLEGSRLVWSAVDVPVAIAVRVQVPSNDEEANKRIALEEEKVRIERSKLELEKTWKARGAVLTLIGIALGGSISYAASRSPHPNRPALPLSLREQILECRLSVERAPELASQRSQTIESLRELASSHRSTCVPALQRVLSNDDR